MEAISVYSAGGRVLAHTGFESIANILIEAPTLKAQNEALVKAALEMRRYLRNIDDTGLDCLCGTCSVDEFNRLFAPILDGAGGDDASR